MSKSIKSTTANPYNVTEETKDALCCLIEDVHNNINNQEPEYIINKGDDMETIVYGTKYTRIYDDDCSVLIGDGVASCNSKLNKMMDEITEEIKPKGINYYSLSKREWVNREYDNTKPVVAERHGVDISNDIRMTKCMNPACETNHYMKELKDEDMKKTRDLLIEIGLVGKKTDGSTYIVDPTKETTGRKPVFMGMDGEWKKINSLLNPYVEKYINKHYGYRVSKETYWKIMNMYKINIHNKITKYWDKYKELRREFKWYVDTTMDDNSNGNIVNGNIIDHYDPLYDYRKVGSDISCCPYCGSTEIIIEKMRDTLDHECVYREKGLSLDCEDTYIVMDGDQPWDYITDEGKEAPFIYNSGDELPMLYCREDADYDNREFDRRKYWKELSYEAYCIKASVKSSIALDKELRFNNDYDDLVW